MDRKEKYCRPTEGTVRLWVIKIVMEKLRSWIHRNRQVHGDADDENMYVIPERIFILDE
jgi:hypothetical protein